MSTTTDGWTLKDDTWEHEDGSDISRLESPWWNSLPWALWMGDPPTLYDTFATVEAAKAAHASGMADRAEARELRRSKT